MLPTSARVAEEMYEPLIGIHYPMLCNVKHKLEQRHHQLRPMLCTDRSNNGYR